MNISKTLPPPPKATHCGSIPGEKKKISLISIFMKIKAASGHFGEQNYLILLNLYFRMHTSCMWTPGHILWRLAHRRLIVNQFQL